MRSILFIVLLFFASSNLHALCHCFARLANTPLVESLQENMEQCKNRIFESLIDKPVRDYRCRNNLELDVTYHCRNTLATEAPSVQNKTFSCDEFNNIDEAASIGVASVIAYQSLTLSNMQPSIDIICNEERSVSPSNQTENIISDKPRTLIHLNSEQELRSVLSELSQENLPGDIISQINSGAVELSLLNDYSGENLAGGSGYSDDTGLTHGAKLTFKKAVGESGYILEISYSTELHTSRDNPSMTGRFRVNPETGLYEGNQYFKEENILSVLVNSAKKGNKIYWSTGGGLQELNSEDLNRNFFLSSLSQQRAWHELNQESDPASAPAYTNLPQEGNEVSVFVQGTIGKDTTLFQRGNVRLHADNSASARITGIEGASYIELDNGLKISRTSISRNWETQLNVGVKSRAYSDQESTPSHLYFEISTANKSGTKVGLRFDRHRADSASYYDAHPSAQSDDKFKNLNQDTIATFFVQYGW